MTAYQLLGLNKAFVLGLEEMGIQHPTYAQTQFIPAVSRYDTDIIAVVKGKTPHEEAYGLPLLNQIDPALLQLQGVVLCNTREECQQIMSALEQWANPIEGLRIVSLFGSVPIEEQVAQLEQGAQIVVAYPGRLIDLLTRGALSMHEVSHVVLHGADELLLTGQREAIDIMIMAAENRRATWVMVDHVNDEVLDLGRRYLPQVKEITIHDISLSQRNISHTYYLCRNQHRFPSLKRLLDVKAEWRGMIICLTRNDGREIVEKLTPFGHPSRFIDSEMTADALAPILEAFNQQQIAWLVMTDVAARNLTLPLAPVMIQYGIPSAPETYYQRCQLLADNVPGGALSVTIITPKFEEDLLEVSHQIQVNLERYPIPSAEELIVIRLQQSLNRFVAQPRTELPEHLHAMVETAFGQLTKEEIMYRVALAEYERLAEKARREGNLNVTERETPPPSQTEAVADDSEGMTYYNGKLERLFVNIGQMDGVTENSFVLHLNRALGIPPAAISNIDLKRTHIHFDIESTYAPVIRTELPKFAVKDRAVRVDDATPTTRDRKIPPGPRRNKRRY